MEANDFKVLSEEERDTLLKEIFGKVPEKDEVEIITIEEAMDVLK